LFGNESPAQRDESAVTEGYRSASSQQSGLVLSKAGPVAAITTSSREYTDSRSSAEKKMQEKVDE
jgi:hypothetical protein